MWSCDDASVSGQESIACCFGTVEQDNTSVCPDADCRKQRQGRAEPGRAEPGRAGQGRAGQGRAGQGRARDWQGREGPSHFLWTGKGRKASRGQGVTCKSRWSLAAWQRTQQKSHSSTRSCAGGCPSHVSSGPCSALPPWAADTAQHLQSTYTQSCTHKSCISAVLHHIIIIIIIIIIIMIIIKTLSSS